MKKLLPFILSLAVAATSYAQSASFSVLTAPCNHNGILSTTFTGVTPPLTVTYYTQGTMGGTIVHTGVTGLTDVLTSYSGGQFFVIATDGSGAKASGYFTGAPPFTYFITPTSAVCPALGTETATVSGGTGPYTYSWYNKATGGVVGTTDPISLAPGDYGVEITDAAGCEFGSWEQQDSAALPSIASFSVAVTTTTANCTNGTATSGTPSGGVPPYTYLWSNGATTPSLTGLTMGTYWFALTDALGCNDTVQDIIVNQAITITVPTTPTPATCVATNGAIIGFGSGGVPPYSYIWSNGATSQSQTGLSSGNYYVNVTDANGCIGSGGGYVGSSTPITVTYSTTPTLCTSPTGTATIAPTGGTGPYTIQWYTTPPQTGATASSLSQGNYYFNVTDAVGCVRSGTVTVPPIDVITGLFTSTPAVCTLSNGSMSVVPSGGATPYTYLWTTGATSSGITSVPAGYYDVTVTDHAGCTAKLSRWLPESSTLGVGAYTTPASCIFVNDGVASATGIGGTPPYSYSWTGGGSTSTITSLPYGPYWVGVTDALGCQASEYTYVGYDTASFCYCTISGNVYYDANGNCTKDAGETGIPDIQISISGRGFTYTNDTGYYSYKVPTGSYTVAETIRAFYPLSGCQLNNIAVSTVAGTGCVNTVDFADAMDTIHDLRINTWDYNKPVPGNTYSQAVVIANNGTVTEPAVLANYNPDGQLYAPSFIPGGVFSGVPYSYNTGGSAYSMAPGATQTFLLNYSVPNDIPLGTSVLFRDTVAYATPISNWLLDYSPWNNVNYFSTVTVASFDPNFKEVSPQGTGATGIIGYSDSILTYMVHFQNTGTSPAENIIVKDTLDNNLNWATLIPVSMSAQGQVTMEQVGAYKVATFTFNDINLPPVSTSPVTSNGMFSYSIHTNAGLPLGTQFKNTASIYFDYNAPVKTNQTLNTLGSTGPDKTNTVTAVAGNSFTVFPNPANNSFSAIINSDIAGQADMKIADISGRTVIAKTVVLQKGAQTIAVDASQLSSGVYFVSLTQNGKAQTQKLVIVKQ